MAPFRPEEVTLPARFIVMTCHLISVLMVLFDVDYLVSEMLGFNADTGPPSNEQAFNDKKQVVEGLCYGAIACFGIEYIGLFLGISMFFPQIMSLYVILHFLGAILVGLFRVDNWDVGALAAFFACFNALPTIIEICMLVFVVKFSFLKF
ncbi:hypothetical protein HYH03_014814 [Edaphochlamys debaryana]|uniref:Transmembrane protein 107 n=1 Tax=Edaphochlamys debaryana TaxID=47281 RepID=A0A835XKM1_9CHLO|nr:hypothetical protein HYH03_014814 [Edaphochlamys debaryana]|eukprot:KAG2486512.1 hypothetical protein HYH03_014814 [Edaphochlamys debaryana]